MILIVLSYKIVHTLVLQDMSPLLLSDKGHLILSH